MIIAVCSLYYLHSHRLSLWRLILISFVIVIAFITVIIIVVVIIAIGGAFRLRRANFGHFWQLNRNG